MQAAVAVEAAPDFELPRWRTGEPARLADFRGQLVLRDFFGYWCVPCDRASRERETGVQKFYAERGGNPKGVPVRVLSVNIEQELPEQTSRYIQRTGASLVANDAGARLLEKFGSSGIPFLVIV